LRRLLFISNTVFAEGRYVGTTIDLVGILQNSEQTENDETVGASVVEAAGVFECRGNSLLEYEQALRLVLPNVIVPALRNSKAPARYLCYFADCTF
jgi:hypothetical protein